MNPNRLTFPVLLFLLAQSTAVFAQLDTIHWIPPMHARQEWGPQFLYLTTPEKDSFPVTIRNGSGGFIATVMISNAEPKRFSLGNSANTVVLVPRNLLHQAVTGKGLVMDAPKKFYAYYRVHSGSGNHAGDLTCKGRAALGTIFRIGHLVQNVDTNEVRSNFVGVLATEDSTGVTLSGFDQLTQFCINGVDTPVNGPVSLVLQKGESVVFSQYINIEASVQPPNGLMGALLKTTKPVAVNCGSWVGAPVVAQAHDIGIDQIAPLEKMGKEYILCKGNGAPALEHPIVIAHFNGTKVWLNGNAAPAITLNAGQYLVVPSSVYSSFGNLYIRTSEPVFMYQTIGGTTTGSDALRTAGLIFVPPISCGISNTVDNIYQPNLIGNMRFEGGLMITAMKDSLVTVRVDGVVTSVGNAQPVTGNPDFVTYRKLNLFTQMSTPKLVSVVAQGSVQVAMYGRNQPASFAAFYSGFSKTIVPKVKLTHVGDGICPDTLVATGLFDGIQWIFEDSILQFGPDTFLVTYAPGRYIATGYLGVCRQTDFAADTMDLRFAIPEFPYTAEEPSCFGVANGQIAFGAPVGVSAVGYQYSIDNGQHFSNSPHFDDIGADNYKLVVRDSTGCYTKPLNLILGQPDSFLVDLVLRRQLEHIHAGDKVDLQAIPDRPVVTANWTPPGAPGCEGCLEYAFHPQTSTWVSVTVYDDMGCPATDSLRIVVEPSVYAPNVFQPDTPNGNDYFSLFSRESLPIRRLVVYDRWGEQIFERHDIFTNQPTDGWDGVVRGKLASPGVYVFMAEVEVLPGVVVLVKGDVTLVR